MKTFGLTNAFKLPIILLLLSLIASCGYFEKEKEEEYDNTISTTKFEELEEMLLDAYYIADKSIKFDFASLPDSLDDIKYIIRNNIENEKVYLEEMFNERYETIQLLKKHPEGESELDQLNAIIRSYHNLIRELNAFSDIYSGKNLYAKYFKEHNLIRMVRTVPSLSDTLHIIIVLDKTYDADLRKFVFLQQTPTRTKELINSDGLMVSRGMSGRMDDMLIDIYPHNDLFTMAIYHGGNWSHGAELTYGKYKNSFKLQNGVGFHVTKLKHSDDSIEAVRANLYFFEQGSELKDLIYGETPDIIGDYKNIKVVHTKRYFKHLENY